MCNHRHLDLGCLSECLKHEGIVVLIYIRFILYVVVTDDEAIVPDDLCVFPHHHVSIPYQIVVRCDFLEEFDDLLEPPWLTPLSGEWKEFIVGYHYRFNPNFIRDFRTGLRVWTHQIKAIICRLQMMDTPQTIWEYVKVLRTDGYKDIVFHSDWCSGMDLNHRPFSIKLNALVFSDAEPFAFRLKNLYIRILLCL
jgi:hypothetical protein